MQTNKNSPQLKPLSEILRVMAITIPVTSSLILTGCATLKQNSRAIIGGTIGCGVGVLASELAGANNTQVALACLAGAAAGATFGHYLDQQEQAIKAAAAAHNAQVSFTPVAITRAGEGRPEHKNGLLADIHIHDMFPTGSAVPTPTARVALRAIGLAYANRKNAQGEPIHAKLLLTGYTDATGPPGVNARLSLQRARSVASIIARSGVPTEDIYVKGGGSSDPVANNATVQGRERNRRVEILEINSTKNLVRFSVARDQDRRSIYYSTQRNIRQLAGSAGRVPRIHRHRRNTTIQARVAPARQAPASINFGGIRATGNESALWQAIGPKPASALWRFSPISEARAAVPPPPPCYATTPQVSTAIYHYSDNRAISTHHTSDYLPGLYGGGWAGRINGTIIGFGPVAILRDGVPVGNPHLFIQSSAGHHRVQRFNTIINVYKGKKGVLYRLYVKRPERAPVYCFDVAILKNGGFAARDGYVYYQDRGRWLQARYRPELVERYRPRS